jgi:O-antigen ligase
LGLTIKKQILIDIYFIVSIILFTGAILTLGGEHWGTASPEGDPIQRGIYLVIYILMLPLLIIKHKTVYQLIKKDKLISIILIISILSILWSPLPFITVRRVIALILTTLYGILFGHYYKLESQINILGYSFGLIVIMCFMYPIFFPEIGIHQTGVHEGLWRGVFVQKNTMASILVIAVMLFIYRLNTTKNNRILFILLLVISFLLIFFSWSTTAVISLLIVYLSMHLFKFYAKLNNRNVLVNILFVMVVLVSLLSYFFNNLDYIVNLFGKDLTLSGRLPLWLFLLESAQDKLLLGYGYGAYWNGVGSPSADVIDQLMWIPNDAHNGYLDIILSIGVVGFIFVSWKIIDIFLSVKTLYNNNREIKYLLIISIIVYILLVNITSTSILKQNSIFWILLVSISIGINKSNIPKIIGQRLKLYI